MAGKSVAAIFLAVLVVLLVGCVTPRPKVAPPTGIYNCPQTVAITDSRAASAIFYTVDGSTPSPSSSKYTSPFEVTNSEKVQAIAIAPGGKASGSASVSYTCLFTRAEFALLMQQQFALPAPKHPRSFPDVSPNDPAYAAIEAAASFMDPMVLCPGCELTRNFFPNQSVTRAVSTVTIVRILVSRGNIQMLTPAQADGVLANIADAQQLPRPSRTFFATAVSRGILPSLTNNRIDPALVNTRDDINAILQKLQAQIELRGRDTKR